MDPNIQGYHVRQVRKADIEASRGHQSCRREREMEPTVPTLGPPPRRQVPRSPLRALSPIVVLSFLQSASFGIMGPMLPIAMTEYFARIYTQGTPVDCGRSPHLEACVYGSKEAAWLSSVFSAVGCGFLFFLSPVLGQASDVYGRKPFLVLSQVVRVGVPFSVMFFTQTNGSIWPYMILRLIDSGVGTAGVMSAAIADVVEPDQRAAAFGLSFASFSVGFCLASFIAPYSSRSRNLQIASGLFVFRVLWATVVLPETLPQRQYTNQKKTWHLENPIKSMAILYRSRLFICLTCLVALTSFVSNGLWQIRTFYLNTVLGFDEKNVAHLMLISGLASIFSQTVVLRPLMNCMRERGVIVVAIVGCIVEAGGFAFTAFYPEKWIAFTLTVPGCLSDLSFAAISSLKSINCSEKEQGRLQGAIYGARAIFEATGPVLFSTLYAAMKEEAKWSRAMPYLVASATYVVGIGVALSLPSASVTAPVPSEKRPLSPVPRPVPLVSPTFAMSPSAESGVSVLYESTDNDSGEEEDMFEPSVAYAVGWEEEVAELARPLMKSYEGDRIDA